jgi:hypothetical protein
LPLLSKSKYLIGIQCPKYFWIQLNQPDKIPEIDLATQQKFDQGKKVGQLAKKLFPEGIDIPESNFKENLEKSKESLTLNKPLFEVAFCLEGLYSRADILFPNKDGTWDILEVKSSTKVKDINVEDVAFQKYVYEKAGIKINKCFLLHINNKFVKNGEVNPEEFFTKANITEQVDELFPLVEEKVSKLKEIMNSEECPNLNIGRQCKDPYDCPLEDECWGFLPESSVFDLYRGGNKSFELFEDGVLNIKEIPSDFKLNDKQGIQRDCDLHNKTHINKEEIKRFIEKLEYPLYYLDFETFSSAIPSLNGTRPYQQIPFQFSLHIDNGKSIKHIEFLAEDLDDRKKLLQKLIDNLGTEGSILVYFKSFEINRLKELAKAFPENKEWVENILKRVVDLIEPFQNFHYYNPKQKGSCSIKSVLPVLVDKSYKGMNISNGEEASISFLKQREDAQVRKDLLKYCELDTEAMLLIVKELEKLTK